MISLWTNLHAIQLSQIPSKIKIKQILLFSPTLLPKGKIQPSLTVIPTSHKTHFLSSSLLNKKKKKKTSLVAKCTVNNIQFYSILTKSNYQLTQATDPKKLRVYTISGSYQLHKKISEKLMTEYFPNLMKVINPDIQEAQ